MCVLLILYIYIYRERERYREEVIDFIHTRKKVIYELITINIFSNSKKTHTYMSTNIDTHTNTQNTRAQSVRAAEYTKCIIAGGQDSPNEYPVYDTKQ